MYIIIYKQNVFDDYQAGAEYLIREQITRPSKITISGGSNGGLLVGACINQRPDLFGCGLASVGVLDMLRFHKFTIGAAWKGDYGDPDVREDFEYLLTYSPLHNVDNSKSYPAVLLTTGDHDDRVVPLHSLKMIATLQYELSKSVNQNKPLMIRVETNGGHGAGKPLKMTLLETADKMAFVAKTIGISWRD